MPRTPDRTSARKWVRPLIIIVILLIGGTAAMCSWFLRDDNPWLSNFLANVAVVVLLLIPGETILSQVRERVTVAEGRASTAESTANAARATADAARVQAAQTAKSLSDIQAGLVAAQQAELDEEIGRYTSAGEDVTREGLLEALRRATAAGIITEEGVRTPIWETDVHYRFVIDTPEHGNFMVVLEEDDTTVLSATEWPTTMAPETFFQALVDAVRAAGHDLGTGLNVPTQSVEQLLDMLAQVTRLRAQELSGHRDTLRKIIERDSNGWFYTEQHVLPADNLTYRIDVSRLDEIDWASHLDGKGWHWAAVAIGFARRLYRIPAAKR